MAKRSEHRSRRRGAGEGSIFRMKNEKWRAQISVGVKDGKARYRTKDGDSRKDVQNWLDAQRMLSQQGVISNQDRQTLGAFINEWVQHSKPNLRYSTWRSYEQLVRIHIVPTLGFIQLRKLTPDEIQRFITTKLESGLSANTVRYLHTILRLVLGRALKLDKVTRNVAMRVDPPKKPHEEIQPLTPDQASALLKHLEERGDRLYALYAVALAAGLRQGEALGLRWPDVDLDRRSLTVRATLQRDEAGVFVFVPPKTKRSRRTIRLPQIAVDALYKHRARLEQEREFFGAEYVDHWDLVFPTSHGTPFDASNLLRHFARIKEKIGLAENLRFHDLRHTCASLLIAQGVHPRQIMATLGHSQISLTMDVYGHLYEEAQVEVADKMDQILNVVPKTDPNAARVVVH